MANGIEEMMGEIMRLRRALKRANFILESNGLKPIPVCYGRSFAPEAPVQKNKKTI
jgi:hypothetical protein